MELLLVVMFTPGKKQQPGQLFNTLKYIDLLKNIRYSVVL